MMGDLLNSYLVGTYLSLIGLSQDGVERLSHLDCILTEAHCKGNHKFESRELTLWDGDID
jgi:hypothetical protein